MLRSDLTSVVCVLTSVWDSRWPTTYGQCVHRSGIKELCRYTQIFLVYLQLDYLGRGVLSFSLAIIVKVRARKWRYEPLLPTPDPFFLCPIPDIRSSPIRKPAPLSVRISPAGSQHHLIAKWANLIYIWSNDLWSGRSTAIIRVTNTKRWMLSSAKRCFSQSTQRVRC